MPLCLGNQAGHCKKDDYFKLTSLLCSPQSSSPSLQRGQKNAKCTKMLFMLYLAIIPDNSRLVLWKK